MAYNSAVSRPGLGSTPGAKRAKTGKLPAPHQWLQNVGLIVIVLLILAITITRYWHNIHWSAR
jgi:hypothetical protein